MNEYKPIKFDPQKKLDIIFNIPGFDEFVRDAFENAKLKVCDYAFIYDVEDPSDFYVKRSS